MPFSVLQNLYQISRKKNRQYETTTIESNNDLNTDFNKLKMGTNHITLLGTLQRKQRKNRNHRHMHNRPPNRTNAKTKQWSNQTRCIRQPIPE